MNPRSKGRRYEYEVRDLFRSMGFAAERVPLSGASRALKGDVMVSKGPLTFFVECKRRKRLPAFAELTSPFQIVAIRADRGDTVFVVSEEFMRGVLHGLLGETEQSD